MDLRVSNWQPIIIIGAGIAGLGAARELQKRSSDCLILEVQEAPGGLLRSDQIGPFVFDRASHFLHTALNDTTSALRSVGVSFREVSRRASVLLEDTVVPYPLQFNLWAAPPNIRKGVYDDFAQDRRAYEVTTFGDLVRARWGPTLTDAFFEPYHEKLWGVPIDELPSEWGSRFIPAPNAALLRKGLREQVSGFGYNASFLYPESGRIAELPEKLAASHASQLKLNTRVTHINLNSRIVTLASGEKLATSGLVSTIPLPLLLSLCGISFESELFAHANILNVRVGFKGVMRRPEHWYYVPDRAFPFFRICVPKNINPVTCPPGCASLSIECGIGQSETGTLDPFTVANQALQLLSGYGAVTCKQIMVVDSCVIVPAYVANRMETTPSIRQLADKLAASGVMTAGRYGAWDYFSIDQAFESGVRAAQHILKWLAEDKGHSLGSLAR